MSVFLCVLGACVFLCRRVCVRVCGRTYVYECESVRECVPACVCLFVRGMCECVCVCVFVLACWCA